MNETVMRISIDALKPHPDNQEYFDDIEGKQYEEFKNYIKQENIITPLLVSPDMTIISGHQRLRVARELGMKIVPVMIREDLIDEKSRLRVFLVSNMRRTDNDKEKQCKAVKEYERLCNE